MPEKGGRGKSLTRENVLDKSAEARYRKLASHCGEIRNAMGKAKAGRPAKISSKKEPIKKAPTTAELGGIAVDDSIW